MQSTTPFERGNVVLVAFPFTDLSSSKRRPALVISPDSFNRTNQDIVLAAITSQPGDDDDSIAVGDSDFANGRLPKPSRIKHTKIFTMHSSLVVKRVAVLNEDKMQEVLRAIRDFYS